MRVVLIGYGAIARSVAALLPVRPSGVKLVGVLVRAGRGAAYADDVSSDVRVVEDVAGVLELAPDLVAECAGHGAVRSICPAVLRRGVDVAIVSTGALADDAVRAQLIDAARTSGAQLHVCSGALAGIDAIAAARRGGLTAVVHTITKPPDAWRGTPVECSLDLDRVDAATVFYEGSARAAARDYPQNANATATVALAGLGLDATLVRLVADPASRGNRHSIAAEGAFGVLEIEVRGQPLDANPKTSSLTAYSLLRTIEACHQPLTL